MALSEKVSRSYLLLSWFEYISVGLEERTNVQRLAPPQVPMNGPIEGELERPAIEGTAKVSVSVWSEVLRLEEGNADKTLARLAMVTATPRRLGGRRGYRHNQLSLLFPLERSAGARYDGCGSPRVG